MNRICHFLTLLLCLLLLTACGGGDVSETGRQMGEPTLFSEKEVADAMDEVEKFFKAEFDGCKLLRLAYDEEKTMEEAREWSARCGAEAIVLISDFSVDGSGGDGSLNPGETYRNWKWILKKTNLGWKLETWGYGCLSEFRLCRADGNASADQSGSLPEQNRRTSPEKCCHCEAEGRGNLLVLRP